MLPVPPPPPSSLAPGFGPDDPVVLGPDGFHVPEGGFHVDPWGGVDRAIITHAHADHARGGSRHYLCTPETAAIMRVRIGPNLSIDELPYGASRTVGGVRVSLHPAGHVLGSAQVRMETSRGVWVISGDYGVHPNPTCAAFEPVPCDTFISECTFGLPIYRWGDPQTTFESINAWWAANAARGRTSVLLAYALGKAQRLLDGVDHSIGPVLVHGAMRRVNAVYAAFGQARVDVPHAAAKSIAAAGGRGLIVAPPSAAGSPWLRRFEPCSLGLASGWMRVRGTRRRRAADRGFVLSDHADWDGLIASIRATGCTRVGLTHGSVEPMARYLSEQGWTTAMYETRFEAAPDADADAVHDETKADGTNADETKADETNPDVVPAP